MPCKAHQESLAMKELYKVLKDHKNNFMQGLVNVSYRKCYRDEVEETLNEYLSSSDLDECGGEHVVRVHLVNPTFLTPLRNAMSKLSEAKLIVDQVGLDVANPEQSTEVTEDNNEDNRMLSDKLTVLINDINIAMKSCQYGLYRGKVYKKLDKAKYTYAFKCEARVFVNTLASNEHFKARLLREMKKVIEILSDPYCEVIRPLNINYDLIEVMNGQCWSIKERRFVANAIPETSIGVTSPRAFCKYDPSKEPEPKYFKEILENSLTEPEIASFCHDFLKLLDYNKKKHKDKVPCLVGDANSGKTSLFLPMLGIMHHSNIATVTKQRAFNKAMINKFTELVFLDEATASTMDVDDWKTLTQGGYMAHDVKYHTAKSFINRCPMLITAQQMLDFKDEDKPAMDRRLNYYEFKSLSSTKRGAAEWLKRHPMDCVVWASSKAREFSDGDEDEDGCCSSDEEDRICTEEGVLKPSEKEDLRNLSLSELLEKGGTKSQSEVVEVEQHQETSLVHAQLDYESSSEDDERIHLIKRVLNSCAKDTLRYRQAQEMLSKERRRIKEEENRYKTKQNLYKERGVSTGNLHLIPRKDDQTDPTPIAEELKVYAEKQEESRKKAQQEKCKQVFEGRWICDIEKKYYECVMTYRRSRNADTRSGAKGMLDIYNHKLESHHKSLGTWQLKEALDERRRKCIELGLLSQEFQHLVQSLSEPLPFESEQTDDDIYMTPRFPQTICQPPARQESKERSQSQDEFIINRKKRKLQDKDESSQAKKRSILDYFSNMSFFK